MAKTKPAEQPAVAVDPAAQPGAEAATPAKPKKERIFQSALSFGDVRKKDAQLMGKFNRTGRSVKGLKLDPAVETNILDQLKAQYEVQAKALLTASENGAEATAETPAAETV